VTTQLRTTVLFDAETITSHTAKISPQFCRYFYCITFLLSVEMAQKPSQS